jgi:hypothetical protein
MIDYDSMGLHCTSEGSDSSLGRHQLAKAGTPAVALTAAMLYVAHQ